MAHINHLKFTMNKIVLITTFHRCHCGLKVLEVVVEQVPDVESFLGVRSAEELLGNLTEVVDESDDGGLLERIRDAVDVDVTFVKQIVEDVHRLHCSRPLLLVSENQVNPFVEVRADVITLERLRKQTNAKYTYRPKQTASARSRSHLSMSANEFSRIAFRPNRKNDVIKPHLVLFHS